jgi:hypothetical protein
VRSARADPGFPRTRCESGLNPGTNGRARTRFSAGDAEMASALVTFVSLEGSLDRGKR